MTENIEATSEERKSSKGGISMRIIGAVAIVIAILLAFFAFSLAGYLTDLKTDSVNDEQRYVECSQAVNKLQQASDYLTTQARMFVNTGRVACMDSYVEEISVTNRRGEAVSTLRDNFPNEEPMVLELEHALTASDELAKSELAAMKLACEYYGIENVPEMIANATLDPSMQGLPHDKQIETAKELVLGKGYDKQKDTVTASVKASSDSLLEELNLELDQNNTTMQNLLFQLRIAVALLLCVVMILVLVLLMYVLKPLSRFIKHIEKNEPLEPNGAYELRYLAGAYNTMYENNNKRIEQLRASAERDPLTGISNRSGYDNFLSKHTKDVALLLIDIDNFKDFNTVYGHDTGDAVLKKLADALSTAFRSTDYPCRIESDKFAVIMTNMNTDMRETVVSKIDLVNTILADDSDDLPLITLSVGAAFSTDGMDERDIYNAADTALRHVQQKGYNGLAFYGEGN